MAKIEKLVEIDRAPGEVFDLLCSADNLSHWLPGVTQAQLIQGNHSRWFLARDGEADAEIVERRVPEYVRWRVSRGGETLKLAGALIETQSGDTILRISVDDGGSSTVASTHSLEQDLFGATTTNDAHSTLDDSLQHFKSFAEGGRAGVAGREVATTTALAGKALPASAAAPVAAPLNTQTRSATAYAVQPNTQAANADSETTLVTASPRVKREAAATPAFSAPVATASTVRRDDVAPQRRGNGLLTLAAASLAAVLVVAALAWAYLSGRSDAARHSNEATQSAAIESAPLTTTTDAGAAAQPTASPSVSSEPASDGRLDSVEPSTSANDARAAAPDSDTSQPALPNAPAGDAAGVLRESLDQWIAATNAVDLGGQMRFYAPTLERYYLRRGFTRDAVRDDKAALARRAKLRNVETENTRITVAPDNTTATMLFRKNYSFDDSPTRSAVLQELRWRRTPEGWRIISERDLRVLR